MFHTQRGLKLETLNEILLPRSEFAQKQVGVMAGIADVVQNGGSAHFAGVIDYQIAETQDSLRDARGNCHILDLRERDIARSSCNQAGVDLDLGIGQRITNHVSPDVVVGGNQQQRERQRH